MPQPPSLIVEAADTETVVFPWGRFNATCGPEVNGAGNLSAGIVRIAPGGGHERHNHPGAEEILFVVSGQGVQMIETVEGEPVTAAIGPGSTVFVPTDRFHSTMNQGPETLLLFVVYSPAGPELVPRTMPGVTLLPPARPPGSGQR